MRWRLQPQDQSFLSLLERGLEESREKLYSGQQVGAGSKGPWSFGCDDRLHHISPGKEISTPRLRILFSDKTELLGLQSCVDQINCCHGPVVIGVDDALCVLPAPLWPSILLHVLPFGGQTFARCPWLCEGDLSFRRNPKKFISPPLLPSEDTAIKAGICLTGPGSVSRYWTSCCLDYSETFHLLVINYPVWGISRVAQTD